MKISEAIAKLQDIEKHMPNTEISFPGGITFFPKGPISPGEMVIVSHMKFVEPGGEINENQRFNIKIDGSAE